LVATLRKFGSKHWLGDVYRDLAYNAPRSPFN
jgi:hypothetical protein